MVFGEAPIAPLEAFDVPEMLDPVGEGVVEDVTKDAVAAAVAEEDDEMLGTAFA